jgi:hypothetical protein
MTCNGEPGSMGSVAPGRHPCYVSAFPVASEFQPEPTHEMAAQSHPKKLPRLNWRLLRWVPGWCPQTGSEYPDKPVCCETGSNSEPVSCITGSEPKPVLTEPERVELLRLWLQAVTPAHHAQCLLEWLQARGHGGQFKASVSIRDNAAALCRTGLGPPAMARARWRRQAPRRSVRRQADQAGPGRGREADAVLQDPVVELAAVERKRA